MESTEIGHAALRRVSTHHIGRPITTRVVDGMQIVDVDLTDLIGGRLAAVTLVTPPSIEFNDVTVDLVIGGTTVFNPSMSTAFTFDKETMREVEQAFFVDKVQRCKDNAVRFQSSSTFMQAARVSWRRLLRRRFSTLGTNTLTLDTSGLKFLGLRVRPLTHHIMKKFPKEVGVILTHYRSSKDGRFVDPLPFDHLCMPTDATIQTDSAGSEDDSCASDARCGDADDDSDDVGVIVNAGAR